MSKFGAIILVLCLSAVSLPAQTTSNSSSPAVAAKKEEKKEKQSPDKTNPFLSRFKGGQPSGPVTTEIYADQAFFDANKNIGIFNGHVKVADPRFTLQSDKLTVYITKGENQGLEKAIAEGNVAVVRDRQDPNGGASNRAVGRSDQATYIASTGNVELRGTPRVQEGVNTHVATSPDTIMIVNQNGQLTTRGPSRTEIRQEPKSDEQKNDAKPASSPKEPGTS